MLSASESEFGGPGFEYRSGHLLDYICSVGGPEFKFSAKLVNSQLVTSCQLGFLILPDVYVVFDFYI